MFHPIIRTFFLATWIGMFIISASAQEENRSFQFLPWPEDDSILSTISQVPASNRLDEAWHAGRLQILVGKPLSIISSKSDSLDKFLRVVLNSQPDCIEGDPDFIAETINRQKILYVSILKEIKLDERENSLLPGELIFLDHNELWHGKLGVIHPDYPVGGRNQIAYWKEQTGRQPEIMTLYSVGEVLRHLFVGSIQAAAVPLGALDLFLLKKNRIDIIDHITRVQVPGSTSHLEIFLRRDHYTNLLMRTLVTETWLRDHLSEYLQPSPVIGF